MSSLRWEWAGGAEDRRRWAGRGLASGSERDELCGDDAGGVLDNLDDVTRNHVPGEQTLREREGRLEVGPDLKQNLTRVVVVRVDLDRRADLEEDRDKGNNLKRDIGIADGLNGSDELQDDRIVVFEDRAVGSGDGKKDSATGAEPSPGGE